MARSDGIDNMSSSELAALEARIGKLKTEKQGAERAELKAKLTAMAKAAGFEISELFGDGRRRGKGSVAAKYRDKNGNTWTGRGRPPRWLTAALKARGVKKEDFLIK